MYYVPIWRSLIGVPSDSDSWQRDIGLGLVWARLEREQRAAGRPCRALRCIDWSHWTNDIPPSGRYMYMYLVVSGRLDMESLHSLDRAAGPPLFPAHPHVSPRSPVRIDGCTWRRSLPQKHSTYPINHEYQRSHPLPSAAPHTHPFRANGHVCCLSQRQAHKGAMPAACLLPVCTCRPGAPSQRASER